MLGLLKVKIPMAEGHFRVQCYNPRPTKTVTTGVPVSCRRTRLLAGLADATTLTSELSLSTAAAPRVLVSRARGPSTLQCSRNPWPARYAARWRIHHRQITA